MRRHLALAGLLALLLVVLAGCAPRASQTVSGPSPGVLGEATARRLIAVWQTGLCRYIADAGGADAAALSALRRLRAPNVLRPARIRFGVLDVEAGGGRWDVQGVLVGQQKSGPFVRHVFMVGIVGHREYLSSEIRDLRLVTMAPVAGTLVWETSPADAAPVARYRATFEAAAVSRFPADDDDFRMQAAGARVAVHEARSGAAWVLALRADLRELRGALTSRVRHATGAAAGEACVPRPAGADAAAAD
jgi:hypothetical protein